MAEMTDISLTAFRNCLYVLAMVKRYEQPY